MTFASHLSRGVALSALTLGLSGMAAAQDDGFNFHVLSNFGEVAYSGIGAGIGSTPGVDVSGYYTGGHDLQGATMTNLGEFGYKQAGMRLTACIFNASATRLDFPAILTTEHGDTDTGDGFNFHHPFNFLRPGCGVGTANPGVAPITTGVFGAPTGAPPGASFQWIIFGLPTGLGIPTSALLMSPNGGLLPSGTNSGTIAIVSALSVTAAISAAGCYNLDLDWTAVAGSAVPALDDVNGWWTQLTASRDNNQYWTFARDNLNVVNSDGAASSGGLAAVFTWLSTTNMEFHMFSLDPATNAALVPANHTGDNSYYAAGAPGPTGNAGYDLGSHAAISNSGITGSRNIFSGADAGTTVAFPAGIANAQDTANAALNIGPTPNGGAATNSLGFTTWNNNTYATVGSNADRLTWVQADIDLLGGGVLDPKTSGSVTLFFGNVRVPVRIPNLPSAWPSSLTQNFWPVFLHSTVDQTGNTLFPDPSGLPSGSIGVAPIAGSSIHIPVAGATGSCAFGGLPVGLAYGTTGLSGPASGPLIWDPTQNRVSFGRSLLSYD